MHHCWEHSICWELLQKDFRINTNTVDFEGCSSRPDGSVSSDNRGLQQQRCRKAWQYAILTNHYNSDPIWCSPGNETVHHCTTIQVKKNVCGITLWWFEMLGYCTLKERMNIKVDSLAKKALICAHATNDYFNCIFSEEDFCIFVKDTKVTGPIKSAI